MIVECDLGVSCVVVKQCIDENEYWTIDERKFFTDLNLLKTHGILDAITIWKNCIFSQKRSYKHVLLDNVTLNSVLLAAV